MKVDCRGLEECWPWTGAKTEGYGRFKVDGRAFLAHRLVYRESFGVDMALWMVVMHKCDNPSCCNPRHLVMGTKRDNAIDMARKGRMFQPKHERKSESSGLASLNNSGVVI